MLRTNLKHLTTRQEEPTDRRFNSRWTKWGCVEEVEVGGGGGGRNITVVEDKSDASNYQTNPAFPIPFK